MADDQMTEGNPQAIAELLALLTKKSTSLASGDDPDLVEKMRARSLQGALDDNPDLEFELFGTQPPALPLPQPMPASGPASDAQFYALGGGQVPQPMPASGPAPLDPAMRYAAGEDQSRGPALASRTMSPSGPADPQKVALQEALKKALREGSPAVR